MLLTSGNQEAYPLLPGARDFDFEDGTAQGWSAGWGDALVSVEPSQDLAAAGNGYALKVNTNFTTAAAWQTAAIRVSHGVDLADYARVEYDVFVPKTFGGALGIETDLNNGWLQLDYGSHDIAAAPAETIGGVDFAVIHKTAAIPADIPRNCA